MFTKGTKIKVHGAVMEVVSVHSKGKSLKVKLGAKVTFKRAADCTVVASATR